MKYLIARKSIITVSYKIDNQGGLAINGNTQAGQRPVIVKFTEDEARQVVRSVEWERMMSGNIDGGSKVPEETMEEITKRRAFINQILDKLHLELKQQL